MDRQTLKIVKTFVETSVCEHLLKFRNMELTVMSKKIRLIILKYILGSGKYFAEFIINLKKNGVPLNKIHLLGHSLGSHMVGFAGKYVNEMTKEKIARITATDPARPLFETPWLLPEGSRLSKADAEFVDVIHTDAGNYGFTTAIGHIDFFPNGGKRFQPGCENNKDSMYLYLEEKSFFKFLNKKLFCFSYFIGNPIYTNVLQLHYISFTHLLNFFFQ